MPRGQVRDIRYQARARGGQQEARISDIPPQYLPASWKDVPFYCDSTSDEFGRRGDLYEYPLSDTVGYKDLGRKARRFKVEGWLLGAASLQINLSRQMREKAEEKEPGKFIHPIHGEQMVACVTLTMSADYRKDKKRTRLSWEFVEAKPSQQPSRVSESPDSVFYSGNAAVNASLDKATWYPGTLDQAAVKQFATELPLTPTNEQTFDAKDAVNGSVMFGQQRPSGSVMFGQPPAPATPALTRSGRAMADTRSYFSSLPTPQQTAAFRAIVQPISYAAALVRAMHIDALERLKGYNAFIVQRTQQLVYSASVQSFVLTIRLIIAREMAVSMTQRDYQTVKAALDDLDLIMAIYDEEEAEAAKRCDDVLVAAIRHARAMTAEVILARNIRKPGITEFGVDGLWPSLVIAQRLYNNGQRYQDVENYNPTMLSFWLGRHVIAPAR